MQSGGLAFYIYIFDEQISFNVVGLVFKYKISIRIINFKNQWFRNDKNHIIFLYKYSSFT